MSDNTNSTSPNNESGEKPQRGGIFALIVIVVVLAILIIGMLVISKTSRIGGADVGFEVPGFIKAWFSVSESSNEASDATPGKSAELPNPEPTPPKSSTKEPTAPLVLGAPPFCIRAPGQADGKGGRTEIVKYPGTWRIEIENRPNREDPTQEDGGNILKLPTAVSLNENWEVLFDAALRLREHECINRTNQSLNGCNRLVTKSTMESDIENGSIYRKYSNQFSEDAVIEYELFDDQKLVMTSSYGALLVIYKRGKDGYYLDAAKKDAALKNCKTP